MNLSIGNASSTTRRHLKALYIAPACAVALAAGVVISNSSLESPSLGATQQLSPVSAGFQTDLPSQNPSFVYYIVGSEQEAVKLASTLGSEGASLGTVQNVAVMVDGPETRAMVAVARGEMTQLGLDVRVVEPVATSESRSEATAPVDAAIMAGVISTERAAWIFAAD